MDALDVLTNLDHVIPYFQPIFSADEHRIIGYEIFGRFMNEGQVVSLGPFFRDKNIPDEYRLDVDNVVLTKALEQALYSRANTLLFINRDAELLTHDSGEGFLQLLIQFKEKGLDLNRIVLEISADGPKYEEINHLMNYYRTYGIKIAIDKMGDDSSHIDRIGDLKPDIVKVDLYPLRTIHPSPAYKDILFALSILARKMGSTLLFKNIETVYQLQFAWQHGGRYFQGYYLNKPEAHFISNDILKEKLKIKFHEFILYEKKKLDSVFEVSERFQIKLQELLNKNRGLEYIEMLELLAKHLDKIAFRMYVCDEDGFQKTPNMFYKQNQWLSQPEYTQKNWSWRPYFLENIYKMRSDKKGIMSDLYRDIETGETIRTFSYPLNTGDYLFIDLSYEFIYQHEGLL